MGQGVPTTEEQVHNGRSEEGGVKEVKRWNMHRERIDGLGAKKNKNKKKTKKFNLECK